MDDGGRDGDLHQQGAHGLGGLGGEQPGAHGEKAHPDEQEQPHQVGKQDGQVHGDHLSFSCFARKADKISRRRGSPPAAGFMLVTGS